MCSEKLGQKCAQKNVHTTMFLLLTFAACYCFWPKHERSQIMCQLCGSGQKMKDNKLVDMYIVQDSDRFWGLPYMDDFHEERFWLIGF